MSLPLKNASISSATASISGHVARVETGNNVDSWCVAEKPGFEIKIREIPGRPVKTDQSTATGPKWVERIKKKDLAVLLFFIRLTVSVIHFTLYIDLIFIYEIRNMSSSFLLGKVIAEEVKYSSKIR